MYSIGEVVDKIEYGYYAVSTLPTDEGTIISVDSEGWIFVIYPGDLYKSRSLSLQKVDEIENKRWEIKEIDEYVMRFFDALPMEGDV